MMFRKIGWLLVLGGVLSALGELLLLQLPTLRWPFDVSRELGWLNAGGEESPFLWFGWLSVMLMIGGGVSLLIKFPRGFQFTPITQRRIDRFCSIKRGHRAFVIVGVLALIAALDQLIVGNEPLLMKYDGRYYSPALERYYETSESGDKSSVSNLSHDITLKKHVNTMHPMMTKVSKEDQEVSLKVNFYCDLCYFNCSVKKL